MADRSERHVTTSAGRASPPITLPTSNYTVQNHHFVHGIPTDWGSMQCRGADWWVANAPLRCDFPWWQEARGAGLGVGGRCWWESCDITGTQSGVSHASTRATTICVSQHLITNQWSAATPPSQISRSGHMSTPPPPPLGGWGNLIDIEFSKTLHFVQEENENTF